MALAGYMRLENPTTTAIKIVSVSSPQFGMIELHRTVIENDVARMVEQAYLLIPANGVAELQPNGWHLMLMMPNSALAPGDRVTLKLNLDSGSSVTVVAPVKTAE
jgi:copper(I)-binding protein